MPSAAAIQRALSATGTPQLVSPATPDFMIDAIRAQRPPKVLSGSGTPVGSNSPRLKSPPPSIAANRLPVYSPRRPDQPSTPSITVENLSASPITSVEGEANEETTVRSGLRTPIRSGMLETVQESSTPTTPAISAGQAQQNGKIAEETRSERTDEPHLEEVSAKDTKTSTESGSESGGSKSTGPKGDTKEPRKPITAQNSSKPPVIHPRKSFTQLNLSKVKIGGEGSIKNMTVETETVSSVPQVAVGGGTSERGIPGRTEGGGTIRLKPSNETIRPRKDRKKTARKAPSINAGTGGSFRRFHHHHIHSRAPSSENTSSQSMTSPDTPCAYMPDQFNFVSSEPPYRIDGHRLKADVDHVSFNPIPKSRQASTTLTGFRARTVSSKADIFEAKVASAVDEANSSDSEETFVYESNPPEPLSARPHRYHSRTPSATSMVSQVDQYGIRIRQDGHHSIAGKKSMKFSSNANHVNTDSGEHGSSKNASNSGRTTPGHTSHHHHHHHHIGRYGRGAGHTSLFDNESPFPNAAKPLKNTANNIARLSSKPASPRSPHPSRTPGTPGKTSIPMLYDFEGEGADDERTPLVGSMRSARTRNSRRPPNEGLRQAAYNKEKTRRYWSISCSVLLGALAGFLIAAIVLALIMCSKPLLDVHVKGIENVLVSEHEIMLDLHVHAINPNLIALQISELSVELWASSKYVGSSTLWGIGHLPSQLESKNQRNKTLDRSHGRNPEQSSSRSSRHQSRGHVDEGTDPIEDPEGDTQKMSLGRIFEFDSPLIFDASPFRHRSQSSVGEVRLIKPGNRTEHEGSERWGKVIQHPFKLIVQGQLRYSLPMSSTLQQANIRGEVLVRPEADIGLEKKDGRRIRFDA